MLPTTIGSDSCPVISFRLCFPLYVSIKKEKHLTNSVSIQFWWLHCYNLLGRWDRPGFWSIVSLPTQIYKTHTHILYCPSFWLKAPAVAKRLRNTFSLRKCNWQVAGMVLADTKNATANNHDEMSMHGQNFSFFKKKLHTQGFFLEKGAENWQDPVARWPSLICEGKCYQRQLQSRLQLKQHLRSDVSSNLLSFQRISAVYIMVGASLHSIYFRGLF